MRTTQDPAVLLLHLDLFAITSLAKIPKTLQWRHRRREYGVQLGSFLLGQGVQRGNRQIGFGLEEIIKTSPLDPRLVADMVNGCAAVRAGTYQLQHRFQQFFFVITYTAHNLILFFCFILFYYQFLMSYLFYFYY